MFQFKPNGVSVGENGVSVQRTENGVSVQLLDKIT